MGKAVISDCGRYRYTLHRDIPQPVRWVRPMLFVMLNPSTADAEKDDATIRRCLAFAKREGCTSLTVVNLFAWRATDPKELSENMANAVGPENDRYIQEQVSKHGTGWIVASWGAHPLAKDRAKRVIHLLGDVWCLGTTKDGSPKHPLYLSDKSPLKKLNWRSTEVQSPEK